MAKTGAQKIKNENAVDPVSDEPAIEPVEKPDDSERLEAAAQSSAPEVKSSEAPESGAASSLESKPLPSTPKKPGFLRALSEFWLSDFAQP